MIAKTFSFIPMGFSGTKIEIEGATSHGLPLFNIVGMGSKTVQESRERVKTALKNAGFSFPDQRLTINLAPADLNKDGTFLDLPIAINILILTSQLRMEDTANSAFVGELSLDGGLRPVRGIINIAEAARDASIKRLFLPVKNLTQASLVSGIELIGVSSLKELFLHLKNEHKITPPENVVKNTETGVEWPNFSQVQGQDIAKRALTIAIAGRHNILLSGPPGTGKTMLAKAALSLLPPPEPEEQIAITKLHSLTGLTDEVVKTRPFRSPHHTASLASITGGGPKASPGEISLAHLGVLFLDELPEFGRSVLESLRQPLEDREISLSRANFKLTYPADFMLIATMNPCPCGFLGDPTHLCSCTEGQIQAYQKKLSGPLLDRIDLFTEVGRIKTKDLLKAPPTSDNFHDTVTAQIKTAIAAQHARYGGSEIYNSSLSSARIAQGIPLNTKVKALLDSAAECLDLSARSYFKIIKVARTIADLDAAPDITEAHLAEALSFRQRPPQNA